MYNTLFYIILAIVVFDFALERLLDWLNSTRWSSKLPDELMGIYDPDRYKKSQKYEKENQKFGKLTSSFSLSIMVAMLFLAGFAVVDNWAREISANQIVIALIFFGILGLAMDIVNTPFNLYDTFVIEEKYGFNKTTLKTFFLDKVKGWILSLIIGGGLLALIIWFYMLTG
ncbi:MAG: M48 family peptidase, partial [Bacteroidales bacterium]|nr:M48 family peptidase [Bacteroidales bacterium]